jgi:hypothetical protein
MASRVIAVVEHPADEAEVPEGRRRPRRVEQEETLL